MEPAYRVQLEVYEGPLELLYQLVEKEQIDIWDIPIARLTDQYLAYLDTLQQLNIDVAAEFLVMAARLLYIKAKMLLPRPEAAGDEDEEDPRLDLATALFEYKLFKEAAEELARRGEGRWALFPRPEVFRPQAARVYYTDPTGGLTVADLARAFQKLLDGYKPPKPIPIPRAKVDVAQRVAELRRFFARRRKVRFDQLFRGAASRAEVIATFLALLELVRQRVVVARQERPFAPIVIETRSEELLERESEGVHGLQEGGA
ncbi:MAG: segregation/condensation protein A [Limnochordia bacterium]|nr:hypothetical protein [Bacillota bacterium]